MRTRTLFAAAIAALFAAGSALGGALEDARRLQEAGDFERALPRFEQAVAEDPGNPDAALGLSEVLSGLGRHEQAAKAVPSDLIDAHPKRADLPLAKGRAYLLLADRMYLEGGEPTMILGYVADADRWLGMALERDPKQPEARVLRARVLQHQGGVDTADAIALLEEVAKDTPGCFDAHFALGEYWFNHAPRNNQSKESYAKAERHFLEAAKVDPGSGEALLRATWARQWQGQTGRIELITAYERAAALLPGNARPLQAILKLYAEGSAAQVRETFSRLREGAPKEPLLAAYDETLRAYEAERAGKGDEAVKRVRAALEQVSGYDDLIYNWLEYTASRRDSRLDHDQHAAVWEALWRKWPTAWRGSNNAGLYYRDVAKDYDRSREWYLRAAEHATSSPQVLQDTGLIYDYHLGKPEEAEKWYRKAIAAAEEILDQGGELDQYDTIGLRDARNNLAKVLIQGKRWKELREFVERHVPQDWPGREGWLRQAGKD